MLWLPPKCVAPRQPVEQDGRLLGQERPGLAERLLVRAQHPVRVDHALGTARRPRREEDLGDGVRADAGEVLVHRAGGVGAHPPLEGVAADEGHPACRVHGGRVGVRVVGEHHGGPGQRGHVAQLGVGRVQQRVGRADRDGTSRSCSRRASEQVLDRVAGKDHHRAARRAVVEQRLREAVRHAPRLAVGDAAPRVAVPVGDEEPVGMRGGGLPEHVRHARGARLGRQRRLQDERAVRAPLGERPRWANRSITHLGPRRRDVRGRPGPSSREAIQFLKERQ